MAKKRKRRKKRSSKGIVSKNGKTPENFSVMTDIDELDMNRTVVHQSDNPEMVDVMLPSVITVKQSDLLELLEVVERLDQNKGNSYEETD